MSVEYEQLAALSVLTGLANNKKNIYDVLWEFVREAVHKRNISSAALEDLVQYLEEDYRFDNIPKAVLKTLLRKQSNKQILLEGENITFLPAFRRTLEENNYDADMSRQKEAFSDLFSNVREYIHQQSGFEEETDEQILKSIKVYLLDDLQSTSLSEVINQYVIEMQEQNPRVQQIFNQIKEGFILYDGICWSENLNELGRWEYPLTLFYDMDIIFYFAGYSGEIFHSVFEEMHQLIREINAAYAKKQKKKCIFTYYFPEVEEQIEQYFKNACKIVDGRAALDPSQTAMKYIVSQCRDTADVVRMQAELMQLLKNYGILKFRDMDFYEAGKHKYNIENEDTVAKYEKKEKRTKVERYLQRINYISLLRGDHACNKFTECEYLMITRNGICAQMDNDSATSVRKQFSRVMSPEVLTSKFWFQLNKGFQGNLLPPSLDVIAQAKIILGHQVNENISVCYESLKKEYNARTENRESMLAIIASLRKYPLFPENISLEVVAETQSLTEKDVKEWIKEQAEAQAQALEKQQYYEKMEQENQRLKELQARERAQAEAELAASEEKDILLARQQQKISMMQEQMADIKQQMKSMEEKEAERIQRVQKRKRIWGYAIWGVVTVALLGLTVTLWLLDYNKFAKAATLLTGMQFVGMLIKAIYDRSMI